MRETLSGPADWQKSVIAVPPMARTPDLDFAPEANRNLIRHLEQAGISIIMCGGNANFYNIAISEYEGILDFLAETVAADTWVIPAIGPAFGAIRDQVTILGRKRFPTAMVLPATANMSSVGIERSIRYAADKLGQPLVVYAKAENYLSVEQIAALYRDGCILFVKYAIVRNDPETDDFLTRLIGAIGAERIVSGIGERPALAHFRKFGLKAFTTGSGSVAPASSMRLLRKLKAKDYAAAEEIRQGFLPLENLRDGYGPAEILHAAVTLAGVADMGPVMPLVSEIPAMLVPEVSAAARKLLTGEANAAHA
ncbi:MAG: dihydrodipicolinate synthase family protein [Bosea sp.]|uniref:dihydrodipicolinate synthase family protein n=1 Tax=Bosea sp. (in: a-proteobacteria) TaxID=1871050 RepID=UPI001AC9F784|nr:dihydrodipicolinate synthase family protein [Bosea sp. (in: a-proteobacteria)]MBN9450334.1 dihydrodipicolinate synthase family protein [Bosea sp. (in: a-proteobacteria)]